MNKDVSAATFVNIKNLIDNLKKKRSTIREIKRALLKKFPDIPKEEWERALPSIFVKVRKPIIKKLKT